MFKVEKLRARWPTVQTNQPKHLWTGTYGLPLPWDITEAPPIDQKKNPTNIEIKLETWEYGNVAMILHHGSYDTETKTIELLKNFVKQQNYQIAPNSHEEIYLSDPNKTQADQLKTIILYRLLNQ